VVDSAGLDAFREHDACGVGFVAQSSGARSHEVVQMALEAVARVAHRGAASTDNSGDGAGLLTQVPQRLFYRDAYRLGLRLEAGRPFAVGVFFLPVDPDSLAQSILLVERVLAGDGLPLIGWRDVPVNPAALGAGARQSQPVIRQVFIGSSSDDQQAFERKLFVIRRWAERGLVDGHVAPSDQALTGAEDLVFEDLLAAAAIVAIAGQEDQPHAVAAGLGQIDVSGLTRALEELVRHLQQDAGAVTGERIATARAAVHQVEQNIDALLDDIVRGLSLDVRNETDAAGVVLMARVV
jgi:hypothetical protein